MLNHVRHPGQRVMAVVLTRSIDDQKDTTAQLRSSTPCDSSSTASATADLPRVPPVFGNNMFGQSFPTDAARCADVP